MLFNGHNILMKASPASLLPKQSLNGMLYRSPWVDKSEILMFRERACLLNVKPSCFTVRTPIVDSCGVWGRRGRTDTVQCPEGCTASQDITWFGNLAGPERKYH